jgi:IPT/TIG domain
VVRRRSVSIAALLLTTVLIWNGDRHGRLFKPLGAGGGVASAATGPSISSLPGVIYVGDTFAISGSGFTPGSVINFFVASGSGPINYGPFIPTNILADSLTVFVPFSVSQGEGVASVQIVNTDQGHVSSNVILTLLQGDPALGFPNLTAIDGVGLSSTSVDTGVALANVETVVSAGESVTLSGSGFDTVNGVGVDLFCDCPGSKVGTLFLLPGDPGLSTGSLTFALPSGASGPITGPGSFQITNLGNSFKSAAVSVPIGAEISPGSVTQSGSTITINGTGFSGRTVINLFNLKGRTVVNLGGLTSSGNPQILLSLISDSQMTFILPAAIMTGPAYVQALNPPFIAFTSSGNSSAGAFDVE